MNGIPLHETKIHGIITFPYSVYRGRIPEWIPSFPLHWHDDFELIYCADGQIQVTVWGKSYVLCAGITPQVPPITSKTTKIIV